MRALEPDEKLAIVGLVHEVGMSALLDAVADYWKEQADQLQLEASISYDAEKMRQAEMWRTMAAGLGAVVTDHLKEFDSIFEEGLADGA